jgi:hypothetical protein
MTAIPRSIQVSLGGFFLAFLGEALVESIFLYFFSLSWVGCLAIFASLAANPLALTYAIKRKTWAYDLLKWIAAFSLVWTLFGSTYLSALGLWAIALITLCVWMRLGALLLIRRKTAKEWIKTNTTGGSFQWRG